MDSYRLITLFHVKERDKTEKRAGWPAGVSHVHGSVCVRPHAEKRMSTPGCWRMNVSSLRREEISYAYATTSSDVAGSATPGTDATLLVRGELFDGRTDLSPGESFAQGATAT